jgi:small conductance mechanosensitive channel
VVRVTLKTMPQQQWVVAREMRERVKTRFDAEGVITPLPQRVVYGDPGHGNPAGGTPAGGTPAE